MADDLNPRRRWNWRRLLQFRLRTLLIAIAVIAVVVGFFGTRWYRGLQEKWAVEALRAGGAKIVNGPSGAAVRVWLGGPEMSDARLAELVPHMLVLRELREVDVVNAPVTDEGLSSLTSFRHIRLLYLHGTQASDGAINNLAQALPGVDLRREAPDPIASKLSARTIYRSALIAAAIAPDGSWLATGSGDGTLRWWNEKDSEPIVTIPAHGEWLFSISISPDGKTVATGGGDNKIKLWSVATRQLAFELAGHTDDVHSMAFDPRGDVLYSAGDDRVVRIWDLKNQAEVEVLTGHKKAIPSIAISPDGHVLATASRDGTVRLWGVESQPRRLLHILEGSGEDVASVAFSPDGASVASTGYDQKIRVWDVARGEQRMVLSGHEDWVFCVAYSADGSQLASGSRDGTLRIWDLPNGTEAAAYRGQDHIASIRFGRGGNTVISTAADGTLFERYVEGGGLKRVLRTRFGDRELAGMLP
jgi:dipeptidyl aminopeptidase/acylaminoacyl peptidase